MEGGGRLKVLKHALINSLRIRFASFKTFKWHFLLMSSIKKTLCVLVRSGKLEK